MKEITFKVVKRTEAFEKTGKPPISTKLGGFQDVGEKWLQGGSNHGGGVSDGATERGGTTDLSCISGRHLSGQPVHPIFFENGEAADQYEMGRHCQVAWCGQNECEVQMGRKGLQTRGEKDREDLCLRILRTLYTDSSAAKSFLSQRGSRENATHEGLETLVTSSREGGESEVTRSRESPTLRIR